MKQVDTVLQPHSPRLKKMDFSLKINKLPSDVGMWDRVFVWVHFHR